MARLEERQQQFQAQLAPSASTETLDAALPSVLVHINGGVVKATELAGDRIKGTTIAPLASADPAPAGKWSTENILEAGSRSAGRRSARSSGSRRWPPRGMISTAFNWRSSPPATRREPELAGILGAIVGSLLTLLVTLVICLPIGVAAAIYLEEFAPKNRLTDLIEVNINNLAAVPSIVFGLLGLAIFLNFFGLPRSAPLVGGLVLALLALPTIIIATRAALQGGAALDPRGGARRRRLAACRRCSIMCCRSPCPAS